MDLFFGYLDNTIKSAVPERTADLDHDLNLLTDLPKYGHTMTKE